MIKSIEIYKKLGQTPLEALETCRTEIALNKEIPMTYAGRLDPIAEGLIIILIGEECKNKSKYLGLDKEYEIEIVFGIETDSYDALGLARFGLKTSGLAGEKGPQDILSDLKMPDFSKYCGKFTQEYPPYSSKTFNGKQLHTLARENDLPDEMPTKEVEIYAIEKVGEPSTISSQELKERIVTSINLVKGDFRQDIIKEKWNEILNSNIYNFPILKLRVKCSSGTYMRSLAHRIGKDAGTSAFALTIKRTRIFSEES